MAKIIKKKEYKSGLTRLALGAAVVASAVLMPSTAHALGIGDVLTKITENLQAAVPLIQLIAYIAGTFLAVTGLIKMKTAVENPQAGGVGPGIVRLILGALLIGLPSVIKVITDTGGLVIEQDPVADDKWDYG